MIRVAAVILVDSRGWLLLQERDEHAPAFPDQWGPVGGSVEAGESDEEAAYRELEEETGIRLAPGTLRKWRDHEYHRDGNHVVMALYLAATSCTDADIVLGEGRQIIFVDPATVHGLPLTDTLRVVLPVLLESTAYTDLR